MVVWWHKGNQSPSMHLAKHAVQKLFYENEAIKNSLSFSILATMAKHKLHNAQINVQLARSAIQKHNAKRETAKEKY